MQTDQDLRRYRVDSVQTAGIGQRHLVLEYERGSLGLLAIHAGNRTIDLDCPLGALFPAVDRTRHCRSSDGGAVDDRLTVGPWATLQLPDGPALKVVEYRFYSFGSNPDHFAWYAPSLGQFAAFHGDDGRGGRDLYYLQTS
ncbi:MAG: hypothetical protein QOI63_1906 [Thermoplasmata archaeon]|nr:hypothetical protein [Thermoplasmata archaeon]